MFLRHKSDPTHWEKPIVYDGLFFWVVQLLITATIKKRENNDLNKIKKDAFLCMLHN
jgi:hypothetical protein